MENRERTGITSDLTGDSGMTTGAGLGGGEGGVTGDAGGAGLGADMLGGAGESTLGVEPIGGEPATAGFDDSAVRNTLDQAAQNIDMLRGIGGDPGDASTTVR